jgi:hypothetical protein
MVEQLRHCATRPNVTSSIPDEVIDVSIDLELPVALLFWGGIYC